MTDFGARAIRAPSFCIVVPLARDVATGRVEQAPGLPERERIADSGIALVFRNPATESGRTFPPGIPPPLLLRERGIAIGRCRDPVRRQSSSAC